MQRKYQVIAFGPDKHCISWHADNMLQAKLSVRRKIEVPHLYIIQILKLYDQEYRLIEEYRPIGTEKNEMYNAEPIVGSN